MVVSLVVRPVLLALLPLCSLIVVEKSGALAAAADAVGSPSALKSQRVVQSAAVGRRTTPLKVGCPQWHSSLFLLDFGAPLLSQRNAALMLRTTREVVQPPSHTAPWEPPRRTLFVWVGRRGPPAGQYASAVATARGPFWRATASSELRQHHLPSFVALR